MTTPTGGRTARRARPPRVVAAESPATNWIDGRPTRARDAPCWSADAARPLLARSRVSGRRVDSATFDRARRWSTQVLDRCYLDAIAGGRSCARSSARSEDGEGFSIGSPGSLSHAFPKWPRRRDGGLELDRGSGRASSSSTGSSSPRSHGVARIGNTYTSRCTSAWPLLGTRVGAAEVASPLLVRAAARRFFTARSPPARALGRPRARRRPRGARGSPDLERLLATGSRRRAPPIAPETSSSRASHDRRISARARRGDRRVTAWPPHMRVRGPRTVALRELPSGRGSCRVPCTVISRRLRLCPIADDVRTRASRRPTCGSHGSRRSRSSCSCARPTRR